MASAGSVAMVIVGDLLAIIGGRRSRTRGFRLVSYCFGSGSRDQMFTSMGIRMDTAVYPFQHVHFQWFGN